MASRTGVSSGFAKGAPNGRSSAAGLYPAKVGVGAFLWCTAWCTASWAASCVSFFRAAAAGGDGARGLRLVLGAGSGLGSAAAWGTGLGSGGRDGIRAHRRTSPSMPAKAAADRSIAFRRLRASCRQAQPFAPQGSSWRLEGYSARRARSRVYALSTSQSAGCVQKASPVVAGRRHRAPHHSPSQSGGSRRAALSWAAAGHCRIESPSSRERS